MTNPGSTDSPLKAAAGAVGAHATEAFKLLSNETRLATLLALWDIYDPTADNNAVSFSDLYDRVEYDTTANFSYHLEKLEGHFVRKTDDGYELRRAGHQIVRAVIAGAGIEQPALEPTKIDIECSFCGAPTAITYQDEWLYIVCSECEGFLKENDNQPRGSLSGVAFDPAGFTNRTPGDMWRAAWTVMGQSLHSAIEGVCDACSGPMDCSLRVCDDHASDGVCDTCGRRFASMAHFHCPVCKNYHTAPPRTIVAHHPAVIAFYYERGVPFQYEVDDFESVRQQGHLVGEHDQELISENPLRIRVLIEYEGDELQLTVDEDLNVTEMNESS